MNAMAPVPSDHPLMKEWMAYQATEDFWNSLYWATTNDRMRPERAAEHGVDPAMNVVTDEVRMDRAKGSLWAAFMAGFNAATERAAALHESVDPASDDERLNKVPGAGAMGAVVQYRDLIRATS